jgi:16S rRNA (guanine527-N7)-methyltransferase
MSAPRDALRSILEQARTAGFLGPGPVETHLDHAAGFIAAAEAALARPPTNFVDLGSGGGVPGQVLAGAWPDARGVLVDSSQRRCAFLCEAIRRIGAERRVEVVERRGEEVGHAQEYRETFELATARSFAAPAPTAEIAAGLVAVGGILVVSEPPEPDPGRWPVGGLEAIGFGPAATQVHGSAHSAHYVMIYKAAPAPAQVPRAVGRPAKRPLW